MSTPAARCDAEQPEDLGRRRRQCPVRALEHGTQVHAELAAVERVQRGAGPQLPGRLGQRGGGFGQRPRRHDAQRQGQAAAAVDQLGHRGRLGVDPLGPQPGDEQLPGLVRSERIQAQQRRAMADDQRRQPVPTGDHRRAAGAAGQQRDHLVAVAGVVQHDQQPLVGHHAPEQPALRVQPTGNRAGVDTERHEEGPQRRRRIHRRAHRIESAQVHVQLAVGETVPVAMRPVQCQIRLADAPRATDRGDDKRAALAELGQFTDASGEAARRGRQLAGNRCRRQRQRPVVGQDPLVQALNLGTRVRPEILGEAATQPRVPLHRLGGATAAVQRQHELAGQALVQRILGDGSHQLGAQLGMPAVGEVPLDSAGQHLKPELLERGPLLPVQGVRGDVDQCRPAPQRPGLVHAARVVEQLTHVRQVQLPRLDVDHIAGRHGADRVAPEQIAQPHDVGADGVPRAGRWVVPPQPLDQLVEADDGVGAQQQGGQQGALLGGGHRHLAAVDHHPQRAQQPVLGTSCQHASSLGAGADGFSTIDGDSDT